MEKMLQEIGFSKKEAKVYLACLEIGKATAFNIAQKADLKRPTVYLVLDDLIKRGLISVERTPKVTYYNPTHPRRILTNFKNKQEKLEENLINLESLYNQKTERPKIKTFSGVQSVENLYDEISDFARLKGKEVLAFGTLQYLETVHKNQYDYWLKSVSSKKCHVREILNKDEYNQKYIETIKKFDNLNHKIKKIPEEMAIFENDNVIFGNKIAIFSSYEEFFVIVIESEKISNTYRALFEIAWKQSKSVFSNQ
ncbi:hypothetical protein KKC88_02315 [Patescibacteria group bacterium]|nr:hypothetical protein [Patescibacteria group bacterium]MBU1674102.1 hypothetical protein [Patescibacteria group bacterium]MBU1963085.1 hypothetical protein [Patescibacteria group bacterium]